jgi:hypothetical protein
MKQYVLDHPAPLAPSAPLTPPPAAAAPGSPRRWRWLLLILLLEPVALAVLYLILNGDEREAAAAPGAARVAQVAPIAVAQPAQPMLQPGDPMSRRAEPEPAASEGPASPVAATSRISLERGRYVVDLHSAPLGAALEMLSSATKARVTGGDIFSGSVLRLTRSAVAATPQEAWQAVFSEVASFAITCAANACDVRFVSLTRPDGNGSPASRQGQSPVQGAAYAPPLIHPTANPGAFAPAWGAAAAPGPEPTSSDN